MNDPKDTVTRLYGGEVLLEFSKKSHRYKISDNGSKPAHCPSVTTILNVLNKPALVEWGVRCACDHIEDGLNDIFASDSYAIDDLFKLVYEARQAHNRIKQEAADIGTEAHDWLSQYWKAKLDLEPPPNALEPGQVYNCITAVMAWVKLHEVKPLVIERPLYSRKLKITGTADFIGWVDGEMTVLDYKSTKQIWPEVALQMAPYAGMYTEEFGIPVKTRIAIRMDKYTGVVEDRRYPADTFDIDMETFMCTYKLYDRLKHLRRKVQGDWIEEL